jgi:hypothetical protein
MYKTIFKLANIIIIFCLTIFAISCGTQKKAPQENAVNLTIVGNAVRITGKIYPSRYNNHKDRAGGHHAVVWSGGGAAHKALIEVDTNDLDVLGALIETGAEPGDNLPKDTWNARKDKDNPAPDMKVEGTPVEILLTWEGLAEPVHLADVLEIDGPGSYEPKVGGHANQISYWKSGCIYCLYSCPGGKISNAGATIRQQHNHDVTWHAKESILTPDGTPVEISIKIR